MFLHIYSVITSIVTAVVIFTGSLGVLALCLEALNIVATNILRTTEAWAVVMPALWEYARRKEDKAKRKP